MTALLRQILVLDLDRGGAGLFEAAHRVHRVQDTAETGIAIDNDGNIRRAADLPDEEANVVLADDAEVGHSHRSRHRGARQI
jgi:hypothetical protein